MKFYMAARFPRRAEMEILAGDLPSIGHECVASWVYGGEDGLSRSDIADLDLRDVARADGIILFTHPRGEPQPGGGRHVEFGYAIALGKRLVVIGPEENVFIAHRKVERFESWGDFLANERADAAFA